MYHLAELAVLVLSACHAQTHDASVVGDKKQAGAAHPTRESEDLRQLWLWTRHECPTYARFLATGGEEGDDDQDLDGFEAHAADSIVAAETDEEEDEPDEPVGDDGAATGAGREIERAEAAREAAGEAELLDGGHGEATARAEAAAAAAGVDSQRGPPTPEQPDPEQPDPVREREPRAHAQVEEEAVSAPTGAFAREAGSKWDALRVKENDVLAIALSPQKAHHAQVVSVTWNDGASVLSATVRWDDGDESMGSTVILYGLQAVRFTIVEQPDPLAVRVGKSKLKDLFRGPGTSIISRGEADTSRPIVPLALTMGSEYHSLTHDSEKRSNASSMATALADFKECMVVSAAVEGHTDAARTLPRLFDLVGTLNVTTGTLVELAVCVGVAFKAGGQGIEEDDLIILGTPVAMMTEGGFGAKSLELSSAKLLASTQRRYLPACFKDPMISVKMLSVDGGSLMMRRLSSLQELTAAVGGKLVEQLKTFMLSWHMLDGLRTAKVLSSERDGVLNDMFALMQPAPGRRTVSTKTTAGQAILEQGAASMAHTVVCENQRAARTETAATVAARETRFFAACEMLGNILDASPVLFGCTSRLDASTKKAILTKLRSFKPLLQTKADRRLQDEAQGPLAAHARNGGEMEEARKKATAAGKARANKRGVEHGTGNSPAGPKARVNGEVIDIENTDDPTSADVRRRGANIALAFESDGSTMTALAAHNLASAEVKTLRQVRDAQAIELESVKRLLASETEAHTLTKAELKGYQAGSAETKSTAQQLADARAEIARLKEKVKQQKNTIRKAEHAAAHNQAMFLAKLEMDADAVKKFMPDTVVDDSEED